MNFDFGKGDSIVWYYDGSFYLGGWDISLLQEGAKHGKGFEYLPGKHVYRGDFIDGKKHGKGVLKIFSLRERMNLSLEGGVVYDGEWVDGKPNGFGTQIE